MKKTRNELISALLKAEKYFTMNSWNGVTSLSRNIKVYNLGLTDKQLELACKLLDGTIQTSLIDDLIDEYSSQLLEKTNNQYTLGFNGRSGGYVVMYKVIQDEKSSHYKIAYGKGFLSGYCTESDFDDWTWQELNEAYKILMIFHSVVDNMIEDYKYMLDNAQIEEEEEIIVNKIKILTI